MAKSVLGSRIHSLRKAKGITQDELGKAVGVTAQAVSNWECGGTPDAEILPAIANYFEVSTDYLFGRTDEAKRDLNQELLWDLYKTETESRFEKAYQYCWSIQQGLFNLEPDLIQNTINDKIRIPDDTKTSSLIYFDSGISIMRVNEDIHNFFMMPTPPDDFRSCLSEPELYEQFFSVLGKPDRMKVLLFLYTRKALALSAAKLASYLDMKESFATEILQDLLALELIQTLGADTDKGEETLYRIPDFWGQSILLIPFLVAAADLMEKPYAVFTTYQATKESIL